MQTKAQFQVIRKMAQLVLLDFCWGKKTGNVIWIFFSFKRPPSEDSLKSSNDYVNEISQSALHDLILV